ncbi:hypothetical protein [Schlesneria paludicola]|uniref:hypothetical protein n=1 Tax=Schlesneria paludicola TaxID=360056 RepID=UPI0012FABCB3|nr:hypothetical protein [Schlesneria paludicola]
MPLTTLAAIKAQAGIPVSDNSRDSQLRFLIEGVSSIVQQQLHRDLELKEYVEYYSGNGSPFLMLHQYPVMQVSSVRVDESSYFGEAAQGFAGPQALSQGIDYLLMPGSKGIGSSGILRRLGSTWPNRPSRASGVLANLPGVPQGNVKVQYTAGFEVIPAAISMAVNSLILRLAAQAQVGGGVQSMSYEDAAVSFASSADIVNVVGSIESTLASFRSVSI